MTRSPLARWLVTAAIPLTGCGRVAAHAEPAHGRYLFVLAMEARTSHAFGAARMSDDMEAYRRGVAGGKDFLAVFDVGPGAQPFGELVAMLQWGMR